MIFPSSTLPLMIAALLTVSPLAGAAATAQEKEGQAQPAAPAPAGDLPDGRSIVAKSIDAMGGKKALEAIKSMTMNASIASPMGEIPMQLFWARPNRVLVKQTIPNYGELVEAFDGQVGWRSVLMTEGYQLLDELECEQLKNQANTHLTLLEIERECETIETVGDVQFDGRACRKVRFEDRDEPKAPEVFGLFDAETHLMIGMEMVERTPGIPLTVTFRFKDWKKTDAVTFFREMHMSQRGVQATMKYTDIGLNNVDPNTFRMPEAVKKLVEEKASQENTKGPDD